MVGMNKKRPREDFRKGGKELGSSHTSTTIYSHI